MLALASRLIGLRFKQHEPVFYGPMAMALNGKINLDFSACGVSRLR